jgi:hypothetical protein
MVNLSVPVPDVVADSYRRSRRHRRDHWLVRSAVVKHQRGER